MKLRSETYEATTDPPDKPHPAPEVPKPNHPTPDVPKPGDPPGMPQPGDPPPAQPAPDRPGPVRPKALSLVAVFLLATLVHAQPASEVIDDAKIRDALKMDLRADGAVTTDDIDVGVDAGVVTLSGKVSTLWAARRATRLAGSLKGVRAVVNRLEVVPSGRTDEQVFADVQATLHNDAVADPDEIQFNVGRGRVTLDGAVDSFAEKWLVETAVAGVHGVTSVDNQIKVLTPTNRADDEVKPEILRRFELNPYLAEGLIEVEVKRGEVSLRGSVGSVNEKDLAGSLCWVAGVRQVDASGLEVKWWLDREQRRDKFAVLRNDLQLQRAVQDALLYDPRVRGMKIDVLVEQGEVSLAGDVSSLAAKQAAEQDAKNTLGVTRVANHLSVEVPDWPGDSAVTDQAFEALARDAYLANYALHASSHFGKVFLEGEVNTQFEKERAGAVVANVSGAKEIVNRITVAHGQTEAAPSKSSERKTNE